MSKSYSADQWRAWFLNFEDSPLTVEQFCKSIGASVQTFYKWRRKLKDEPGTDLTNSSSPRFIPVSLASSEVAATAATKAIASSTLEIELPGGVLFRVANDVESLRPVFELLREWGATQ